MYEGKTRDDMILNVNIIVMMVLSSLYLSVSHSLPVTPNIKPIEAWLLFNMVYPFLIILLTILIQVIRPIFLQILLNFLYFKECAFRMLFK